MLPHTKMIVVTWQSTHVIFNLIKKTLVLVKINPQKKRKIFKNYLIFLVIFCYGSYKDKNLPRISCRHPNGCLFFSSDLLTVILANYWGHPNIPS